MDFQAFAYDIAQSAPSSRPHLPRRSKKPILYRIQYHSIPTSIVLTSRETQLEQYTSCVVVQNSDCDRHCSSHSSNKAVKCQDYIINKGFILGEGTQFKLLVGPGDKNCSSVASVAHLTHMTDKRSETLHVISNTEEQLLRSSGHVLYRCNIEAFTDLLLGSPVILGIPVAGSWNSRTKRDLMVRRDKCVTWFLL